MKLKKYLNEQRITYKSFAKRIDVPLPTVHKWIYLDRVPRRSTLQRIQKITNGVVTVNDFFEI